MKSLATWKLQKATTIGLVEQLLGSHTISGAFLTQAKFRAFNYLGLFIVTLWCLSPLGSQASLRVVAVEQDYSSTLVNLTTLNPFTEYGFGSATGTAAAATVVVGPFAAALFSASLLKDRNQDLWGNIRLPSIERLAQNGSTAWIDIPDSAVLSYPSLVGLPVVGIPKAGNTTFMLPGSYLNVACDSFDAAGNVSTNYTGLTPGGNTDYAFTADSTAGLTIAVSQPLTVVSGTSYNVSDFIPNTSIGARDARRLIWDSVGLHAECKLYTTYVDVNISCAGSICSPSSARRSPQPPRDRNLTVFDLGRGDALDVIGFLQTLTQTFPEDGDEDIQSPILAYIIDPYNAVSYVDPNMTIIYDIGKECFELRLAQVLNAQLLLGIEPSSLTGNFNTTAYTQFTQEEPIDIMAITSTEQDRLHYNRIWLGILILASLALFCIAAVATILRLITLVPDVLGTLSIAMLDNRCQSVIGNTMWSSNERVVKMKGVQVQLGDVEPNGDIGRIGLAVPVEDVISEVQKGRFYK